MSFVQEPLSIYPGLMRILPLQQQCPCGMVCHESAFSPQMAVIYSITDISVFCWQHTQYAPIYSFMVCRGSAFSRQTAVIYSTTDIPAQYPICPPLLPLSIKHSTLSTCFLSMYHVHFCFVFIGSCYCEGKMFWKYQFYLIQVRLCLPVY